MISVGGGAVLIVLAILGAVLSERRWLRLLCYIYIAVYFALSVGSVLFGSAPKEYLYPPIVCGVFAYLILNVKKYFDNWKI